LAGVAGVKKEALATAAATMTATPLALEGHFMRTVHDYVDKHRNCEDLAMSFLVAASSLASPGQSPSPGLSFGKPLQPAVWVRGNGVREIGSSGLSSDQTKHYSARSSCLDAFVRLWEVMPLGVATAKVDQASAFWWWR